MNPKIEQLITLYGNIPALSIQQPWAWLIVNGPKDIENRNWSTRFRGRFFVHSGKKFDWTIQSPMVFKKILPEKTFNELVAKWNDIKTGDGYRGGIVGISEITGCVDEHLSDWFFGEYGFVLNKKQTIALNYVPLPGKLRFFKLDKDSSGPPPKKAMHGA